MKTSFRSAPARAFTLLELLVVISIIAVLAGILLPVGSGVLDRAKKVDARVTMTNVITAIKAYQTEYGQYPTEPPESAAAGSAPQDVTFDIGSPSLTEGKGGRNGLLFDVLRALNNVTSSSGGGSGSTNPAYKALNSRKIVYFESKDVKNVKDPRGGFIPTVTSGGANANPGFSPGDLVDPFGNLYCFRIDSNYTDVIMQPYKITGDMTSSLNYQYAMSDDSSVTETDSARILRVAAAGFCAGKDKKFGDTTGALTSSCDDVVTWQ